jgi:hypothetical protein
MNTTLHGGSENELFLNTTSLAKHLSIFEEKLGDGIPLKIDLTYQNMDVIFAEDDLLDIVLDYTLNFQVSYDDKDPSYNSSMTEDLFSLIVFYDELQMQTAFNIDM